MYTAEARITTNHGARYLAQLCRHASKMGRHLSGGRLLRSPNSSEAPPAVLHIEHSEAMGTIRFGEGQCILRADDNALLLRVEARTERALQRIESGVGHRLETFGRRENLTVHWQPAII